MPVQTCQLNGKPGYRYGTSGKCYTYTPNNKASEAAALRKAHAQETAIKKSGYAGG